MINTDKRTRDTLSGLPSEARPKGEGRFKFSSAFLLRSQKTIRGMKTSASNPSPPTAPPTIVPTGVCLELADVCEASDAVGETCDAVVRAGAEVEAGGVKTRLGMEARLENEGVYVTKSKTNV